MSLPEMERKTDCFAYTEAGDRCTALTALNCEDCAFYKSRTQLRTELTRVGCRLAELHLKNEDQRGNQP